MQADPFALDELPVVARPFFSLVLGLRHLRRLYAAVTSDDGAAIARRPFEERVLAALEIAVRAHPASRGLPAGGPVVIASNHPHGIVDGLALMSLCRRTRPDVRVVVNHVLARIPELHDFCFFVDPFDGAAPARSLGGLRAAHRWLRSGGALIVFPAGEVAHGAAVEGCRLESPWKSTMERLARATGARILNARIDGGNSRLFYAAGRLHPTLRTMLLAREFLNKRGSTIGVRLAASEGDAIAEEIARLPQRACLVTSGAFRVYCATALQIPATLREIGRLREIAFRAVGEGTGRTIDLDEFDHRYQHLFLWDADAGTVAGAYRIGPTDEIVAAHGVEGLYTRSLFRYDARLFDRIGGPALELGRSFVARAYQKNYSALLLLWKGIGRFVARERKYRFLFGPVSISARYSDTSHLLLMEFLRQNHLAEDLAALVEAINPRRPRPASDPSLPAAHTIDEVNRLVATAERDGKGVPVLLRQYLRLNAQLIGFNVDAAFGDALDALMIVDLTKVEPAILARYLGRASAASFLRTHLPPRRAFAA